jgi:hypothetical protein
VPIVTVQQSPRDLDARRALVFIAEFDHEHWAKGGSLAVDCS